jgi:hypothetical protein
MTTSPSDRKRTRLADMVPPVILMRAEGRTLQQIADALKVSKQRVSQIVYAAKAHEAIQARWGFPFSVRTDRVLEALAVDSKEKALELYHSGHLFPGAVWSFGHRSYREICEWLGVPPLKKRPKHGNKCPHCQGFI